MQVILLENVQNLGVLGDSVRVRPGYARNFLIPRGKAVPATPANLAEFETRRAELERQQAEVLAAAQVRADGVEGTTIIVRHKAGDGGKLFGSVGSAEVVAGLLEAGHEISRGDIRMAGESIRELGEFAVGVQIHAGIEAAVTLIVEGEGGERAEDYVTEDEVEEDLDEGPSDEYEPASDASDIPADEADEQV